MTEQDADISLGLHLGAHKTATTHLQRSLADAEEALRGIGISYCGPSTFRGRAGSLTKRFGIRPRPGAKPREPWPDALGGLAGGASRVLISEENFTGGFRDDAGNLALPLYRDAPRRLGQLIERAGPLDLFFAIRQPTGFLNSAYGQVIQSGRAVSRDAFVSANAILGVDWTDLMRRLRAVPGLGRMVVWRYEDYTPLFARICTEMLGPDGAACVQPLAQTVHGGLSAQAIETLYAAYAQGRSDITVAAARAAYPVSDKFPRLDIFDTDTHRSAQDYYAAQLDEIDRLAGVTRLTPAKA